MGITLNDIAAQRAMLARGEEKRKAAKQAAERERLRDTFAAAALTGLLSNVQRYQNEPLTKQAFEIADFMLRERGNHSEKPNSSTNHDAAPEARAESDEARTDKAAPSQCKDRPGDTPHPQATPPQGSVHGEGTVGERLVERVLITQSLLDDNETLRAEIARLREAIRRLAEQDATLSVQGGSVTVTMDATLTDKEREAIEWASYEGPLRSQAEGAEERADTLRKLLERLHK